MIDRDKFFDKIRSDPFPGMLTQRQVDGISAILDAWENEYEEASGGDLRWLANPLGQTFHETSQEMWPIEEYGKGGSADYAQPDPITKQCYYGRGYIQLTWDENYSRADRELELEGDKSCYWHAENALDPDIAAAIMFQGMIEGWFRTSDGSPNNLAKYFNDEVDDAFEAREIINGDKNKVPDWSDGVSIGKLVANYHHAFLEALEAAFVPDEDLPEPPPEGKFVYTITLSSNSPIEVKLISNTELEEKKRGRRGGASR